MRRFESDEWWREIGHDDALVVLRVGKHGKPGLERGTLLCDETEARSFHDAKVAGYLANGYVEIDEPTAAQRHAAAGEPMRLPVTTPEQEREQEAERERLREEREARRERENEAQPKKRTGEELRARLDERMAERLARVEARAKERTDTWPAPPRLFERIALGAQWGILRQGERLFVSGPLGNEIAIRAFDDDAAAQAEMDRLIEEKRARGWVPHVERTRPSGVRIAPRRHAARRPDATRAFGVVRAAFLSGTRSGPPKLRWRDSPASSRLLASDEPMLLEPRDEHATAAMLERACPAELHAHAALVDFWVASRGPAFALDALTRSAGLAVRVTSNGEARITSGDEGSWPTRYAMWGRLRDHLADVPPESLGEARSRARQVLSRGAMPLRCAIALAMPFEASLGSALFDELRAMPAMPWNAVALLASVPDGEQAKAIVEGLPPSELWRCAPYVDDLVDTLGEDALGALRAILERTREDRDATRIGRPSPRRLRREAAAAIGRVDTAAAAALVADGIDDRDLWPGLVASALLRPSRFVDRVAPAAASGGTVGAMASSLLTWMLRREPELRAKAPGEGARRALRIAAARAAVPTAREPEASSAIPDVLRAPPWRAPVTPVPRPASIPEPLPLEDRVVWPEGVREAWLAGAPHVLRHLSPIERDALAEEGFDAARETGATCDARHLVEASSSIALAAWREIAPERWRIDPAALRGFVASHELAALSGVVALARARPADAMGALLPFGCAALAPEVARALLDRGCEADARAWLGAHPEAAAVGLIPIAAGGPSAARDRTELALHALAPHRELVLEIAERYGARELVGDLLDHDSRRRPPPSPPVLFDFWDGELLPAPLLRATGRALPIGCIDAIGEALVLDRPELEELRDALDPASLGELATELALRWMAAGSETDDAAALRGVGIFGDDDGVRLVADLARAGDDEGDLALSGEAIRMLERRGSETAVLHLSVLARKARTAGMRRDASRALTRLARAHGLDVESFLDARVPDLGLDADSSLVLDAGGNVHRVAFDEQLRPFILDAAGTRVDTIDGGTAADPERAADAEQTWRRLRRDASAIAAVSIERLEEAMVARREISLASFARDFRAHPLLRHLARRLVWQTDAGARFRVAEDDTLADDEDSTFELDAARSVRLAHPLELSDDARERWAARFADYELLQPFAQIDRRVHRAEPTDEVAIARFEGGVISRVGELERRGFERVPGAGLVKRLPWAGASLHVDVATHHAAVTPGTILRVFFRADDRELPLAEVHPIDVSEAIEMLERAVERT